VNGSGGAGNLRRPTESDHGTPKTDVCVPIDWIHESATSISKPIFG
jgi:hypothetical protein